MSRRYLERFEQSISAARKAIEISPSFALGHYVLGMALLFSGHASDAIAPLEYGLKLSPYDPQNFVWFNVLALARLFSGRPEAGLEAAARALQIRPKWWTSLEVLVCCYAALGKWDEAGNCMREMGSVTKQPGDVLAPLKKHNPIWTEQMNDALQKAGAYWTNACQSCAIKHRCTTGKERRIVRWEHERVLEAVQRRLDEHPEKMRQRRETVEHPFGTIKSWMGSTHFQMKTLKHVGTEMALHVLAYNMKRVMRILGVGGLMEAIYA